MNKITKRLTAKDIFTIPNGMSLIRLLLIPVIVYVYAARESYTLAAALVVASGITDILDGFVARRFNMVSDLGKFLDPVADKLTQGAVMICLCFRYPKLRLLLFVFAVRELVLFILGCLTLHYTDTVNSARWYGKAATAILEGSMFLLLLFPGIPPTAADALIYLCLFAVLAAFVLYVGFFMRALHGVLHRLLESRWASKVAVGLAVLLWAAVILVFFLHRDAFTVDTILNGSPENMALSALMMLALFAVKSVSIVLYSGILYITSGLLFPLPVAILVSVLGTVIMLTIPFFLGRLMGKRALDHIHEKYERAAVLRDFRGKSDFLFSFASRVINLLPADLISIYMGAAGLRYVPYITGGTLGSLAFAVLLTVTGGSVTRPTSPEFLISVGLELVIMAVSLAVICLVRRRKAQKARETQKEEPQEL